MLVDHIIWSSCQLVLSAIHHSPYNYFIELSLSLCRVSLCTPLFCPPPFPSTSYPLGTREQVFELSGEGSLRRRQTRHENKKASENKEQEEGEREREEEGGEIPVLRNERHCIAM